MLRRMLILLAMLSVAGMALADNMNSAGTPESNAKAAMSKSAKGPVVLNNVVRMDGSGSRTALCCCGAEFTVTDNAPTTTHDGTNFYLCGDGCKQMTEKATKADMMKTMKAWHKKYKTYKMADNTMMKDGKQMATCLCGKVFDVTSSSPYIIENGVKTYLCSDACNSHLHGMSADDRLKAEMAELKPADATPAAATPTGQGN